MDGGKGDFTHLDAHHHKGHGGGHISHIPAGGQGKGGKGDVQKHQHHAGHESHERRRAEFLHHFAEGKCPSASCVLHDEVGSQAPEHGGVGDVVQHGGGHALFAEEGHVHRKADENGVGNAAGAGEDAPPPGRNVKNGRQEPPCQVGCKDGGKGEEQIRRRLDELVMGEIGFQRVNHKGRQGHGHGQAGEVLPRRFPEPSGFGQIKSKSCNEDHFKYA